MARYVPNQQGLAALANTISKYSLMVAEDIVQEARNIVPVRSGRLRDSIEAKQGTGVVSASVLDSSTPTTLATVEADTPYAAKIESEKPFLEPAVRRVMEKKGR